MQLTNQAQPVPIWVADGGDGTFGPGDWFEFVGERLAGADRYYHPYTRQNIYSLNWGSRAPARMHNLSPQASAMDVAAAHPQLSRHQHLEHDQLLIRLANYDIGPTEQPELWFWAKLSHIDPQPLVITGLWRSMAKMAKTCCPIWRLDV